MDALLEMFWRGWGAMLARFGGPLNFRLFVMPIVVSAFAIRAGIRDAREGKPPFLLAYLTDPADRPRLFRSALKDVGKVFTVAIVLDTTYQLMVLRWLYPVQVLVVAVACAVVPYVLLRGPVNRIARASRRDAPAAKQ
jgi:hypothetical protein